MDIVLYSVFSENIMFCTWRIKQCTMVIWWGIMLLPVWLFSLNLCLFRLTTFPDLFPVYIFSGMFDLQVPIKLGFRFRNYFQHPWLVYALCGSGLSQTFIPDITSQLQRVFLHIHYTLCSSEFKGRYKFLGCFHSKK